MAQQFAYFINGHSLLDEVLAKGSSQIVKPGVPYAQPSNFLFELVGYIVFPV